MAFLSDDLIKEFAKTTNDKQAKKSENFMYGTVKYKNEDEVQVHLDGAPEDTYTPCTASVAVEVGDRVLLLLKNRQAVITSNVSSPSINAGYLEAGEAVITGTIHAARYEDTTGNFTMDIGTKEEQSGRTTPAFRIGGYVNGNPNNDYLEVEITLYRIQGWDLPVFTIAGSAKTNPNDINPRTVSMMLDDLGIHFTGSWVENGQPVRVNREWQWL